MRARLLLLLLAALIAGCGGSHESVERFSGVWSGIWGDAQGSGSLQLTISGTTITGTIRDSQAGLDGIVSGAIGPQGSWGVSILFNGLGPRPEEGFAFVDPNNGHLVGFDRDEDFVFNLGR